MRQARYKTINVWELNAHYLETVMEQSQLLNLMLINFLKGSYIPTAQDKS